MDKEVVVSALNVLVADENALFSGFAGSDFGLKDELPRLLVVEHGRSVLGWFLSQRGEALAARNPRLAAYLTGVAASDLPFSACWSPAFGLLYRAQKQGFSNARMVEQLAVGVALELAAAGMMGGWQTNTPLLDPTIVGDFRFPNYRRFDVLVKEQQLDLTVLPEDGSSTLYVRFDLRSLSAPKGQNVRFLTEGIAESQSFGYLADTVVGPDEVGAAMSSHSAAMTMMENYAPAYADWVRRVVHTIVPLRADNGLINSGSSRYEPGVVHASSDCPVEGYAEMLVHEACHQYFYIAKRLGPLEDGSDPNLYFSPVKNTGRPIEMILLAYHAFANVVLLGRAATREGYVSPTDYFRLNDNYLLPIVATLETGLQTSPALTDLGNALWRPLADRLRNTG